MTLGPLEIAVLLVLALTLFGGGRFLPPLATTLGRALKSARDATRPTE